jgi:hypothetical protein
MQIDLKDYKVKIKDTVTWGESKDIQDVILKDVKVGADGKTEGLSASVMREATYKTLEIVVQEIWDKDGKKVSFSKQWMDSLDMEDGNKLEDKAQEYLGQGKKKI